MRFRLITKPKDHMIDLSDLSPFPDMVPPDDIDLEDGEQVEEYLYAHSEAYDDLLEAVHSLVEDEFPIRIPDTVFLFYDYTEDQKLYYQILSRMLEASFNYTEYTSITEEPIASNEESDDTSSEDSDSGSSDGDHSNDGEDRQEDDEYRSDNDDPEEEESIIPRPRGIPQPKVSSVYMEELAAQRTRVTKESAAASRTTRIKSNFVEPDRPPQFQGIEPVKLRPGIDMDKFEYNGAQITVFRNRARQP